MRSYIEFHPAGDAASYDPAATRLGGQPHWLEEPAWPVDAYEDTGGPMVFLGQFRIDGRPGETGPAMAYLFAAGYSGEHTMVVQPGGRTPESVEVRATATGPTESERAHRARPAELPEGYREPVDRDGPWEAWEDGDDAYEETAGSDDGEEDADDEGGPGILMQFLGGPGVQPIWLQSDEHPGDGWELIVQLDSCSIPLSVNFGDTGVGYGWLSPDRKEARFFFQSC